MRSDPPSVFEGIRATSVDRFVRRSIVRIQTLYEFLVLTTKLNFTETAKGFFISQSVLSDHISNLEKELGTRLFVRDRHSVRLTEAGHLFKEGATAIIADYEKALEKLDLYRNSVSSILHIGFLMGSYGAFLPALCERYRKEHPETEFRFHTLELGEMQPALQNGQIDIGFMVFVKGFEGSQFTYRTLYTDKYKLAVPKNHPLARKTSVSIADLKGENVISSRFEHSKSMQAQTGIMLRNAGIEVSVIDEIRDVGALMATLVSSNAVALALDHLDVFGGGNIVFLPIDDLDTKIYAGPVWKTTKETDVLLSFIAFLQKETRGFEKDDFISRKGFSRFSSDK